MLKKVLFTSAVLALTSSVAFANAGPYVGAGLGVQVNTSSGVASGIPVSSNPGNFRGVPFNVFAGYGSVINQNFYLAGELNGTLGTGEISNSNKMKTSYGYGASVLPGVMLSDHTLAFARVGIVRTRFSDANQTATGGQVGVGLQTSLTQNVDVRGEYDYTGYGSFNNSVGRVSSPRTDAFNASLIYKFE